MNLVIQTLMMSTLLLYDNGKEKKEYAGIMLLKDTRQKKNQNSLLDLGLFLIRSP